MRTNRQIAIEVEERTYKRIWQKILVKKTAFYSSCAVFCILIIGVIVQVRLDTNLYVMEESPHASLVYAGSGTGGYVLVGILALVLGVVITMVCLYTTEKNRGINNLNMEKGLNDDEK